MLRQTPALTIIYLQLEHSVGNLGYQDKSRRRIEGGKQNYLIIFDIIDTRCNQTITQYNSSKLYIPVCRDS